MLSPTAMNEKEGRKKRNGGKKIKRKEEATNVRTNVDTSALDGAALSFQLHEPWHGYYLFNASRTALHNYLHRVAWSARGWRTRTNEEERKMAICESSTPTNPASCERRARGSTVYISVYKRGETRPICTNNPTHIAELVCNAEFSLDSSY